jgi:hypothetical protein
MFLIGDVPSGGQPHFEWSSGFVKNGSRCHAGLVLATLTNQAIAASLDGDTNNAATRAGEFFGPTQPFQIIKTGLFTVEPVHELTPRFGVILSRNGLCMTFAHQAILPSKELSG